MGKIQVPNSNIYQTVPKDNKKEESRTELLEKVLRKYLRNKK